MSTPKDNPFVMPGMGQDNPDMAGNPLFASMEMMRKAWSGLSGPGGLAQSLPMSPPTSPDELDKRIAELKSIEGWLSMNLSMLSSTIQGMEVQRSTIATLRSFVDAMGGFPGHPESGQSPLEAVLGIKRPTNHTNQSTADTAQRAAGGAQAAYDAYAKPDAAAQDKADVPSGDPAAGKDRSRADAGFNSNMGSSSSGAQTGASTGTPTGDDGAAAAAAAAGLEQAQAASQAWWEMLQGQFNQLAAATVASMPHGVAGGMGGATARPGAGAGASSASGKAAGQPRADGFSGFFGGAAGADTKPPAARAPTKRASGSTKKATATAAGSVADKRAAGAAKQAKRAVGKPGGAATTKQATRAPATKSGSATRRSSTPSANASARKTSATRPSAKRAAKPGAAKKS